MIRKIIVPYSGKLSREKTFMNFAALDPPTKVSSTKFGCAIPTHDRFSILQKFSPRNGPSYRSAKVSRYMVSYYILGWNDSLYTFEELCHIQQPVAIENQEPSMNLTYMYICITFLIILNSYSTNPKLRISINLTKIHIKMIPSTHSAVAVAGVQQHIDWTHWTWPACCRVLFGSLAQQREGERSRCQTGTACTIQHNDLEERRKKCLVYTCITHVYMHTHCVHVVFLLCHFIREQEKKVVAKKVSLIIHVLVHACIQILFLRCSWGPSTFFP